jgi:hypothetical protein
MNAITTLLLGVAALLVGLVVAGIVGGKNRNKKAESFKAEHPEAVPLYFALEGSAQIYVNSVNNEKGFDFNYGGENKGVWLLPGDNTIKVQYYRQSTRRKIIFLGPVDMNIFIEPGKTYALQVNESEGLFHFLVDDSEAKSNTEVTIRE